MYRMLLLLVALACACGPERERGGGGAREGDPVSPADGGDSSTRDGGGRDDGEDETDAGASPRDGGEGEDAGVVFQDAGEEDAGSPPEPGGTTLSGSVDGRSFTPAEAIAHGSARHLAIEVTNRAATCATVQGGASTASTRSIGLFLAGTQDLAPGTLEVDPSPFATTAFFVQSDEFCDSEAMIQATSGSITLTRVEAWAGGVTTGTFDVWFQDDRVTGSFTAGFCDPFPAEREGCE